MPFPAVPIFFYNELDGRGPISIRDGFDEHFEVMRWWASIDKPVEINDPHQWQLRNSTDDLLVTDHVIAGVVALKMGIRQYVMQMMYDLPPGTSGLERPGQVPGGLRADRTADPPFRLSYHQGDARRPVRLSAQPGQGQGPPGGVHLLADVHGARHRPRGQLFRSPSRGQGRGCDRKLRHCQAGVRGFLPATTSPTSGTIRA